MNSNVRITNRKAPALPAALVLACIWAFSAAVAGEQGHSITVKFQDLNVDTAEGVKALYGRIHAAAWRVCASTSNDPLYQEGARECARQAEAKAIETVNLPQLTAFYREKTGNRTQPLSASR